MALKWKEVEVAFSEAKSLLEGSILQKFAQGAELAKGECFILSGFHEEKGPWRLFVSLLKDNTCACLLPADFRTDAMPEPSTFVMVMRKHVLGRRLMKIEQTRGERVVMLHLETGPVLLLELIPKYGNLLLLENWQPENNAAKCITSFRQVSLETGAVYKLPPPPPSAEEQQKDFAALGSGAFPYNNGIAQHYWTLLAANEFQGFKREWQQAVKSALKKMKTALDNTKADLAQAEEAELFKKRGLALVAHLYQLGPKAMPKAKKIVLDNLEVPLDTSKNYADNSELLFKKSKKFTRASSELLDRLQEMEARFVGLEALAKKILESKDEEELQALEKEFTRYGLPVPEKSDRKENKKEQESKPYIEIKSSDGFLILCGRNQEENRRVTFQESKGNDLWLHVKGMPGAHVVVKSQKNKTIPLSTMLEAAQLTLYHSKIRKGKRAEVDYTYRKHVKPIKGTLAEVSYTGNKTLYVEADPEILKKILK